MPTYIRILLAIGAACVAVVSIAWSWRASRTDDTETDDLQPLPNDDARELGVYDREATRQIDARSPRHQAPDTREIATVGRRRREDRDPLGTSWSPFMAGLPYNLPAAGAATAPTSQAPPLALPATPHAPVDADLPDAALDAPADREPTVPMVVERRAECTHLNRRNFDPPTGGRS